MWGVMSCKWFWCLTGRWRSLWKVQKPVVICTLLQFEISAPTGQCVYRNDVTYAKVLCPMWKLAMMLVLDTYQLVIYIFVDLYSFILCPVPCLWAAVLRVHLCSPGFIPSFGPVGGVWGKQFCNFGRDRPSTCLKLQMVQKENLDPGHWPWAATVQCACVPSLHI